MITRLAFGSVLLALLSPPALAAETIPAAPATTTAPAPTTTTPAATPAPDAPVITDTTPAPPAGPKLSDFAYVVFDGIVGENAPEVTADFAAGITVGTMPVTLEKTTLDQLQQAFGGLIHSSGDAGDAVSWLCYTQHAKTKSDTPETAWFTSTSEMAAGGNTLSMVVVENVDAAKAGGCATAPKTFAFPTFSVPAIGTAAKDIKAHFGALSRDRQHNVYYTSARALNDGSGKSVYQTLGYVVGKNGLARGIAVTQTTTD